MLVNVLKKIFGSRNERLLKQYRKQVTLINELEPKIQALSDEVLRAKTEEFKNRLKSGETLDSVLPEAFAVVREASKRVLGMRHFDVQLIGGMALHNGKIAEMRTGEGKTLVATLPSYLNALSGNSVHIVTVNDYLAKRDSEWMGRIHQFLGLTVGVNLTQMSHVDKQAAYAADITYGTNNEFGFDYLRDNMVTQIQDRVQRGLHFAIVDEVDSILIDEARTPLIISGQADDSTALYETINKLVPRLTKQENEESPGDYNVDLKAHQVLLSEEGHEHAEQLLTEAGMLPVGSSLYDPANILLIHHLYAGIRAHALFHLDQHYVVQNGEIIIVDEFTGRMMPGRRWSDGLHQAVEAKEGVKIQHESQTLASITFQNYFRMYGKLAGMTGTADTEAFEFQQIYNLETVIIPTHRPVARKDFNDQVFQTAKEKHNAIILDIKDCYERGQPVLVGTTSIEQSELLSNLLQQESLPHQVLNAKQHAREADIVVQAGRPKMITIATNMAGRGTDIVLGGNPEPEINAVQTNESLSDSEKENKVSQLRAEWQERHNAVIAQGGLHIIGSERHESRRIDNQLRGRSGRQGDVGSTRFYLSLEDQLLKIFAADRIASLMQRLKIPEGEAIESPLLSRVIENAQRKVEARNFDIRKQLLEYDDVANEQRKVIYEQRNELLESQDISETIQAMREDRVSTTIAQHIPPQSVEEQWDVPALEKEIPGEFNVELPIQQWLKEETTLDEEGIRQRIIDAVNSFHADKFASVDREVLHHYERAIMLQSVDIHWREHLAALDHLRQGIHLRGYAQKNPKQEYKREAFELFASMLERIKQDVTKTLLNVPVRTEEEMESVAEEIESTEPDPSNLQYQHAEYSVTEEDGEEQTQRNANEPHHPYVRPTDKVGRNDPCPCGSGKKYKQCHGKIS